MIESIQPSNLANSSNRGIPIPVKAVNIEPATSYISLSVIFFLLINPNTLDAIAVPLEPNTLLTPGIFNNEV